MHKKFFHIPPWGSDPANNAPVANMKRILHYTDNIHAESYPREASGMYGLNHINIQLFVIVYRVMHSIKDMTTMEASQNIEKVIEIVNDVGIWMEIFRIIPDSAKKKISQEDMVILKMRIMMDVYRYMTYIGINEALSLETENLLKEITKDKFGLAERDAFEVGYGDDEDEFGEYALDEEEDTDENDIDDLYEGEY